MNAYKSLISNLTIKKHIKTLEQPTQTVCERPVCFSKEAQRRIHCSDG